MKILLDENLSPRLVPRLGEINVSAQHVAHIGMSAAEDPEIWEYAFDNDFIVATINADDFLRLANASRLHAGVIAFRSHDLRVDQQWEWLKPAALAVRLAGGDLTNQVVEVKGPGVFNFLNVPEE